MNEDCLNWTDYLLSSQKGGWSYLPLSKPFLVPASFLEHTPFLCFSSFQLFTCKMEAKWCSSNHPPHLSWTTVLLPSWHLCTSFPLPGPPSPCSSAQSVLWAKCFHLRGAFPHLWGCLPWNCPWCQKWGLLPGCMALKRLVSWFLSSLRVPGGEWMFIEGERQFQVEGGIWAGRNPRRPLLVAFRCQWLPLWTTQTWSWTGSGDHPGLSRPECGGLWPRGSFTTLWSFWWVRETSVICRQLLV